VCPPTSTALIIDVVVDMLLVSIVFSLGGGTIGILFLPNSLAHSVAAQACPYTLIRHLQPYNHPGIQSRTGCRLEILLWGPCLTSGSPAGSSHGALPRRHLRRAAPHNAAASPRPGKEHCWIASSLILSPVGSFGPTVAALWTSTIRQCYTSACFGSIP
jgi:hypothetical protein